MTDKTKVAILLTSVFIIAICGILYELLISTISSYFQGSSILHFSIVIGIFLSFMGVGSYFSKFIQRHLISWFIGFEILLSIVGGLSALLLYFAFSLTPYFYLVTFIVIAILGSLIGVEIPILTRIVRRYETLKDAVANVLSFDYLGALIASVAFPLLLLPILGTMKTAFLIGLLNLGVAISNTYTFKDSLPRFRQFLIAEIVVGLILLGGLIYSFQINRFFEQFLYRDEVIVSEQSQYQHIVMTKWNKDIRMFIDGNLQFSSLDEYRYHEPLVHIPMALTSAQERILILGGGDGFVTKELLKYPTISQIEVIDLDPTITDLAQKHPVLTRLNDNALNHKKVTVYNQDAYKFIEESSTLYDLIIIDLPDPNNTGLGKLYSKEFYSLIKKRLSVGGVVVTQSTSPYFAPDAFWCIHNTLQSIFPITTTPYTIYVPSFGQWGFNMAINTSGKLEEVLVQKRYAELPNTISKKLFDTTSTLEFKYLNKSVIPTLFTFDEDMKYRTTEINKLNNQVLIQYYEKGWEEAR